MSWTENLRKASFRGAEFWWEDADTTLDPLTAIHKYPQKKGGWTEDLGLGSDEFGLVGYVLGEDYMAARDALIKAVKDGGAATLVHPTMGEKTVVCTGCQIKESTKEGGMARFTFKFMEEGENKFPEENVHAAALVDSAADTADGAAIDAFEADFDTMDLDFLENDAARALGEIGAAIEDAFAGPLTLARNVSGRLRGMQRLVTSAQALIRSPRSLAQSLLGQFGDLGSLGNHGRQRGYTMTGLQSLSSYSAPAATSTSTDAVIAAQDANQAALVRRGAAITAARAASASTFDSRDEAVATRDQVARQLDQVRIEPGTPGQVFRALTDLRAASAKDIGTKAGSLARLRRVTMGDSLPAAVVAHRELGDARRAGELVERNRIKVRNPLFVPAGETLEVLDD